MDAQGFSVWLVVSGRKYDKYSMTIAEFAEQSACEYYRRVSYYWPPLGLNPWRAEYVA
jgi:hypothetical protein